MVGVSVMGSSFAFFFVTIELKNESRERTEEIQSSSGR